MEGGKRRKRNRLVCVGFVGEQKLLPRAFAPCICSLPDNKRFLSFRSAQGSGKGQLHLNA